VTLRLLALLLAPAVACVVEPAPSDDDDAIPNDDDDDDAAPVEGFAFEDRTAAWGVDFDPAPSPDTPQSKEEAGGIEGDWVMGGGGVLDDLDGDGLLDLFATAPFAPNRLYRGTGGPFELVADSGLEGGDWTFGAVSVDLDADGLRDLLVLADHDVLHFHNDGDMVFRNRGALVTLPEMERPAGVAIADVDGDGNLDMHVCVIGREVELVPMPGIDRVLRGLGGGDFEDVSEGFATAEERTGQCFQSNWFDLDGDGVLELHVANDYNNQGPPPRIFRRAGDDPWVMEEIAEALGGAPMINSMGSAVGDLNGDGAPEIAISDVEHRVLLESYDPTTGSLVDVTLPWGATVPEPAGRDASWAMEMLDVDDDGRLDLLTAWGYPHYVQREDWTPQVATVWRNGPDGRLEHHDLPCEAESWSRRAVLPGDIDRDGSTDLVVTSNIGPWCVLRGSEGNGRLEVTVGGGPGNPDGLGALVEVSYPRRGDEVHLQRRRVATGNSGLHSATEPLARVGTGAASTVDVVVTWPDGEQARLVDVPADGRVHVPRP